MGETFTDRSWSIYFSSIHRILDSGNPEFVISHLQGDLHKLEPTSAFARFGGNEVKEIPYQAAYAMVSESEAMPRCYLTAPGLVPAVIANTDSEDLTAFVAPLTDPKQVRFGPRDPTPLATASSRFADNAHGPRDRGRVSASAEVIPTPRSTARHWGDLDISTGITIRAASLDPDMLRAMCARSRGLGVPVRRGGTQVDLSIDPADAAFAGRASAEAYRLSVGPGSVTIVGGDAAGAFYGFQTLLALLDIEPAATAERRLPRVDIPYDAPRYRYRGLQVDVARNFHDSAEVSRLLDQMAAYKLNALHLHLSDDEGWRLQIPSLPELTEVGGKRCHDGLEESHCILPQLGSGPSSATEGSGYYTRAEFIEILRAANARNIEVIPEFDMPGHARAAIRAMAVRASRGDSSRLLHDPEDRSVYLSIQAYADNGVNVCRESTYSFVRVVMDEVLAMYREAGARLRTWHVGGDEVAKGAWAGSPICAAVFASGGPIHGPDDLHGYFITRVNALAKARHLGIRGWSDAMVRTTSRESGGWAGRLLDPAADLAGNPASVNLWSTLRWYDDAAASLANAGYEIVLSSPEFLYLDHATEADPKERGNSWATRSTDMHRVFAYMPDNLAANAQTVLECLLHDGCKQSLSTATPLAHPERIIGVEAQLWSEMVRTDEQLESMLFPRLLAVAERAWHRADWEPAAGMDVDAPVDIANREADWERFANTVGHKELPKLDRAGVRYRVEVPGARIMAGKLAVNTTLPGVAVEYRNAEVPWRAFDAANPPSIDPVLARTIEVRAVAGNGRSGRSIALSP